MKIKGTKEGQEHNQEKEKNIKEKKKGRKGSSGNGRQRRNSVHKSEFRKEENKIMEQS